MPSLRVSEDDCRSTGVERLLGGRENDFASTRAVAGAERREPTGAMGRESEVVHTMRHGVECERCVVACRYRRPVWTWATLAAEGSVDDSDGEAPEPQVRQRRG